MGETAGHDIDVLRDGERRINELRLTGAVVESFVYNVINSGADGRLLEVRYANGQQTFSYAANDVLTASSAWRPRTRPRPAA